MATRSESTETDQPVVPWTEDLWHASAPRAVRSAYRRQRHAEGWSAWVEHLGGRGDGAPPLPADALAWATGELPAELRAALRGAPAPSKKSSRAVFASPGKDGAAARRHVDSWLEEASAAEGGVCQALESLAWAHRLPHLAASLPAATWWNLFGHLAAVAGEAEEAEPGDAVVYQIVAGELALTLGCLLPELRPARDLARGGRRVVTEGLAELLDGGSPPAELVPSARLLLATWTRSRILSAAVRPGGLSNEAEKQYARFAVHLFRMMRHDGSHVFSAGAGLDALDRGLFETAAGLAGGKAQALARVVLPHGRKRPPAATLPATSVHREEAGVALIRNRWDAASPRLTVLYRGDEVRMELSLKRDVVFSGTWGLSLLRDGAPAELAGEWAEVCWVSDEDVDYLELEAPLTDSLRVQRHVCLARQEGFLLLADSILGELHAELAYRGELPLGAGVDWEAAPETREGLLFGRKPRALVLPLALPEWRIDSRGGELAARDGCLVLEQSAGGRALFAPLLLDLNPRRLSKPRTWRQLTVGQSLEYVPRDAAVAFRAQVGNDQWLVYRSLAQRANRTFLGHNLSTEMLVARFDRSGEVSSLVEIE